MADIFISYSRNDRRFVEALSDVLERRGWTVFWDRDVHPGDDFTQILNREREAARAVIVVWSEHAAESRYVPGEAAAAAGRGTAIPILLDRIELPEFLRTTTYADLSDYRVKAAGAGDRAARAPVVEALGGFIEIEASLKIRIGRGSRRTPRSSARFWVAAAVFILAIAAVGWWRAGKSRPPATPAPVAALPATKPATGYVEPRKPGAERVVVFVHGVLGDARQTWTASNGAYWPDMLREDEAFADSDVFVYDYPTPLFAASYSIDELADNLRLLLDQYSVFDTHKQVVFICHSMGGLVVRAFLLKYQKDAYASHVPMMYFLATPTSGSEVAQLATLVKSRNPQFHDLVKWRDDEYVGNLVRQWLAAGFTIASHCAYEKQAVDGLTIVDPHSAVLLCNRPLDPMLRDHITIAKPVDENDLPYTAVKVAYMKELRTAARPAAAPDLIKVRLASYGYAPRFCAPDTIRDSMSRLCDGKDSCPIDIQNYLCGSDPAPNERKTLRVDYSCGTNSKTATGLDDTKIVLSCP